METTKTTSGVVKLVRNGEVMAQKNYHYSSYNLRKDEIIKRWKQVYGKRFYSCEIIFEDTKLGTLLNS